MLLLTSAIREISGLFVTIGETEAAKVVLVIVAAFALGTVTYLLLPVVLVIALIVLLWELLGEFGV